MSRRDRREKTPDRSALDAAADHLAQLQVQGGPGGAADLAQLAAPYAPEMLGVLLRLARLGKRESVQIAAASRVLDLAAEHTPGDGDTRGVRVIVINQAEAEKVPALLAARKQLAAAGGEHE